MSVRGRACYLVTVLGRASVLLSAVLLLPGCGSPPEPEAPPPGSQTAGSQPSPHPDFSKPDPATLKLASTVWPPFSDREGQPRVAVELVRRALSGAGYPVRTTILGPDVETDEHLRDASYDGSPAVWRTEERERFLLFSDPFLENRIVLVGRDGADVSATSLDELEGQRVGIVSGYAYGDAVSEDCGAELVEGASTSHNLRALVDGDVDYVLADDLVIHYLLELHPDVAERTFDVGQEPITSRTLHFAIRKDHPHAAEIIEQFNRRIGQMVADGTYNEVLHLRWIRADADGDGDLELVLDGAQEAGRAPPAHAYQIVPGDKDSSSESVYTVEGQSYDSWDAVPSQYDVPAAPAGGGGYYGIGSGSGMQF